MNSQEWVWTSSIVDISFSIPQQTLQTVMIDYTYDPLNRLTAADYSTGDYYQYTYDSVGNRLSQEDMVGGQLSVVNYVYDDANRLASVNGVNYTFDDNGNLLSDGVNTYVYDSANRLISVNASETYQYNGLGDRLTQNGTQYALDLNPSTSLRAGAGLTQVLNDGTNSYLYGLGRISQTNTATEYFLGDALGSVRQLSMTDGEISLAQSYDPYGTVTYTAGTSSTPYGFTGETTDANGLIYLRARYYNPVDARFISRDTWGGDTNRPLSLNRWMYVEGNPVNYADPTGLIKQKEASEADFIVNKLKIYNVFLEVDWGNEYYWYAPKKPGVKPELRCGWDEGQWELKELKELRKGVSDLSRAMGGLNKFIYNLGYEKVYKHKMNVKAQGGENFLQVNYDKHNLDHWTVVHELGHSWDAKNNWEWSEGLVIFTNALEPRTKPAVCDADQRLPGCNNAGYVYGGTPAKGSDKNFDAREDFAESLAAYVYPGKAYDGIKKYLGSKTYEKYLYYPDYRSTLRWAYIDSLIRSTIHLQQQR